MRELLDSLLADIDKRVRDRDPTAVERATRLAEDYPGEPRVWHLLAFAHAINHDMDGAVLAMTRMIDIAPPHPFNFLDRGRYELKRGNLQAALADFDKGIALSKQLQDDRCVEYLYFYRAEILVRLGRKAEARADLVHVGDDLVSWLPERRTKADILADCDR
jgi:tetratricopeptide (TPR) repeat protein